MEKKIERYCGNCCWFLHEDTDGQGICAKHYWNEPEDGEDPAFSFCGRGACKDFISREEKRHLMAVLIHHNLWRRDNNVPNSRKMDNATEIGKAIDFVIDYIKTIDQI